MIAMYTTPSLPVSAKDAAIAALSIEDRASLSITPVIHPRAGVPHPASRTFWSAVANRLYITRENGTDIFGPTPDVSDKLRDGDDLFASGRRGPIGCDNVAIHDLALWDAADRAAQTDRPGTPVAHHIIGFLPANLPKERWHELVLEFLDHTIVVNGLIADWGLHALADEHGDWLRKPHFHALVTSRFWKPGRRTGEPNAAWQFGTKQRLKAMEVWALLAQRA